MEFGKLVLETSRNLIPVQQKKKRANLCVDYFIHSFRSSICAKPAWAFGKISYPTKISKDY